MKFTVSKKELTAALKAVLPAVPTRPGIPVLTGVRLEIQRAIGRLQRARIVAQFGKDHDQPLFDPALRHLAIDGMNGRLAAKRAANALEEPALHEREDYHRSARKLRDSCPWLLLLRLPSREV